MISKICFFLFFHLYLDIVIYFDYFGVMASLKYSTPILKILGEEHLSVDDIYDRLKQKHGRVSIATIYRTLDNLLEEGLVTKLSWVGDTTLFEKNKGNHIHFVDTQTKKIYDLPFVDYKNLGVWDWFSPQSADIIVYGTVQWNVPNNGLFDTNVAWDRDQNIVEQETIEETVVDTDKPMENVSKNVPEVETSFSDDKNDIPAPYIATKKEEEIIDPVVAKISDPVDDEKKKMKKVRDVFRQF